MAVSRKVLISRRAFWEKHVSAWRISGLSQAEYCRKAKLNSWSLSHWHNKKKSGLSSPSSLSSSPDSTEPTGVVPENPIASLLCPPPSGGIKEDKGSSVAPALAISSGKGRIGSTDPEAWQQHFSAWKRGSLSIAEYCRRNSLPRRSFHKWKKVLGVTRGKKATPPLPAVPASKATEVKFIPVPRALISSAVGGPDRHRGSPARKSSEKASSMTVCIGRRFRVIVRPHFSQLHLAKVIRTLEEIR